MRFCQEGAAISIQNQKDHDRWNKRTQSIYRTSLSSLKSNKVINTQTSYQVGWIYYY